MKILEKTLKNYQKLIDIIKNIKKFNTNGIIYIVIFVMLINILIFNLKDRIESELTPEYLSYIRKKLFSKTIENNSSNYEDIKTGEYITRILDIIKKYERYI